MKCENCSEEIPVHVRNCIACEADVGFPNVRAANSVEESRALADRLSIAVESSRLRKCKTQLDSFGKSVLKSKAVMCRSLGQVLQLVEEKCCYSSYYQQVGSTSRTPESNEWDQGRGSVDSTLFPHYLEHIRFAALTRNNRGLSSNYGPIAIIFKEPMIVHRASVFEENPFNFCQKHSIIAGTPAPFGYRANWKNRHILAMAKLHSKIERDTDPKNFSNILLKNTANGKTNDFIEVHIFGSFNRSAIELIAYRKPTSKVDATLYRRLKKASRKHAIELEEF